MSSVPAATIVVPLLSQEEDWLRQCLRSALEQTLPVTVAVVTSPQTPESNLEVLEDLQRRHSELHSFERPPGGGFADAINAGFLSASTERIGLLLSDDWLLPTTLAECLAHEADIVATGRRAFAADGQTPLWERIPSPSAFENLGTLEAKASYLGHFFLFRKAPVLAVGGVDPEIGLTGADDYDLPWTLLEHGASVSVVERPLYRYRDHDKTRLTLRERTLQIRDLRRVLQKHGVAAAEIEEHVRRKQRWYGVSTIHALENPNWFREEDDDDTPTDH